jgi:hypothetical protein
MTRDQKIVGIGAASGVAAMIVAIAGTYQLWPSSPSLVDISSRLAYAVQANAFAVIPLLAGIITVGNNRFLSEAIDPTLRKEDAATQINGRVVDNTLQQFVLFLVATTALSVNLTAAEMRIIPGATIVFVAARLAFWVGYRIHPLYRAFGMAATAYLNIGLLALALWKASLGS